jgi:hypothetical protein
MHLHHGRAISHSSMRVLPWQLETWEDPLCLALQEVHYEAIQLLILGT